MREETVDERILWLAAFLCMPRWRAALRFASDRTKKVAGFYAANLLESAGTIQIDERSRTAAGFAKRVKDPVLRVAWDLLALRTADGQIMIHSAVAGAVGLLASADGDTREARARLRVWDDVARHKYDPAAYRDDFFQIADMYWRGEMRFIVAATEGDNNMRPANDHPAISLLSCDRWDDAFGWLHSASADLLGPQRCEAMLDALRDRVAVQTEIQEAVEYLYSIGTPAAGATALAWEMLTASPRRPESFRFLPQLQFALDQANLDASETADMRERIRIWWRAAECEWTGSEVSIFRIADVETSGKTYGGDPDDLSPDPPRWTSVGVIMSVDQALAPEIQGPTLVVMPSAKATKLNSFHSQYKAIVDAPLPLVVARDVARIRSALHAEFPHAGGAVDLLLRDLREGRPVTLRPICLVGAPGAGKSRLVRRLGDLLSPAEPGSNLARMHVYRVDAASTTDGHFGGTSKGWGNTEPSIPMRAVAQSKTANPVVLLDEIDKATSAGGHNGSLYSSLSGFTDRETSARYRDQSLDAEVDLSCVSYISTANDVSKLPSHIRDRFRCVRVPDPTLAHLPALAAQVMRDLSIEDEARSGDPPLAGDELAIIGKAWQRAGLSMRQLQKIVAATLDARDQHAPRH
jgi:ATP-dependent Lon protease